MSGGSDTAALHDRYRNIMAMREGEDEADVLNRHECLEWIRRCSSIARKRERLAQERAVLAAHSVSSEDQVEMLRLTLPAWAGWLAAEAVYGRKPAEDDLINAVRAALNE